MLGLKCVAFGISVSVLLAQSTTSQKAPNIPAGTPLYPPRIMHWCSAHCTTLTLDSGPPFDRPHYGKQGSEQIIIVERWTSDSVLLNRRDNTSRFKGTAILRGRISTDGNSIVDGKIEWTSGNTGTYGYQAAWGAAINTVPGSDAERDRARPPSSNPSGAISKPNSREDLIPSMSEPTAAMKSQKADLNGDWEGYFNSPMFAEVMRVRQTGKNITAETLTSNLTPTGRQFFRGTYQPAISPGQIELAEYGGLLGIFGGPPANWTASTITVGDPDHFRIGNRPLFQRIGAPLVGDIPCDPNNPLGVQAKYARLRAIVSFKAEKFNSAECCRPPRWSAFTISRNSATAPSGSRRELYAWCGAKNETSE